MNDDESILAELRKISAWADMQRKITKWWFIAVAILVPAMIAFAIIMENRLNTGLEHVQSPKKAEDLTWYDVDSNIRHAKLDEAIRIGEELMARMPYYVEGHQRLASAYLAAGKINQAKEHYEQAYRLFPSQENEKLLIAMEKRIKEGIQPRFGASNASQQIRAETNQPSSPTGLLR
jgi:tetratricopeptide (TPR) repeat protein